MATLALLDGHSLAYRAFYALPADLATPAGQATNAVFGFTSMLIKLLAEERPQAIAVAWDTGLPAFRTEVFPEYKAQRTASPDLFRSQLPLIREVVEALNIHQFALPGYEADDVIASLSRLAKQAGWEVLVVSGDRDAFQLIDDHLRVLYPKRGITETVLADTAYVTERYGVDPAQYVDYAALRGDISDNLPGVPGVGEKTAAKLIGDYKSLEGVYDHLEELSPKLKASLGASRQQVLLNRQLMTLDVEVPVTTYPDQLVPSQYDAVKVRELFDALAFRSLWPRLAELGGHQVPAGSSSIEIEIAEFRGAAELGERLVMEPVWRDDVLEGLMVVGIGERVSYVPIARIDQLAKPLSDPTLAKCLHDAKPLLRALLDLNLDLGGLQFDTALAAYLSNPAQTAPSLEDLADRILGLGLAPSAQAAAQGELDFGGGPDLAQAGRRAVAVARLVEPLAEQLKARGAEALYQEVELPLVRVLARMEQAGIGVDAGYLEEVGERLRERLAHLERQIHEAAGEPFNVNSSQQLRHVLFDRLKLSVLKKTPKGQPSTDASVLEKLAEEHPIIGYLLDYRELEKLRSTYVDGLLPLIRNDGRIHARFNQMTASTGRLSSEQPNLQNIPVRSEEGRTIRQAFVAPSPAAFVVADYSQIELRILAHLSQDAGLAEAFAAGVDIHAATAARTFGVALSEVTPELRRRAKAINFGLIYGMEAYGLAQRLGIEQANASDHIEAYFAQFPAVEAFMQQVVERARRDGYTTTILGRRRYLPELQSTNFRIRQMGERMALNAPIQGSAADVIKKAMVSLDAALEARFPAARLLLQVHDELVLECPEGIAEEVAAVTKSIMEGVVALRVSLVAQLGTGHNLAEAKHGP